MPEIVKFAFTCDVSWGTIKNVRSEHDWNFIDDPRQNKIQPALL